MDFLVFRNSLIWVFVIFLVFVAISLIKSFKALFDIEGEPLTKKTRIWYNAMRVTMSGGFIFILSILILGATGFFDKV